MTKHEWKTFYQLIVESASNLSHLYQFECKIYALNKYIFRKWKLHERTHINHLLDYDARNIFRIWISSQRKIIRTRDVIFDEKTRYDAHDVDLLQTINESIIETIYEVENIEFINVIREIDSNKNDFFISSSIFDNIDFIRSSNDQSEHISFIETSQSSESSKSSKIYLSISSSFKQSISVEIDQLKSSKSARQVKKIEIELNETNIFLRECVESENSENRSI